MRCAVFPILKIVITEFIGYQLREANKKFLKIFEYKPQYMR